MFEEVYWENKWGLNFQALKKRKIHCIFGKPETATKMGAMEYKLCVFRKNVFWYVKIKKHGQDTKY